MRQNCPCCDSSEGCVCVQSYPPLPFDCCDSSATYGSIWDPVPDALGEGRPTTTAPDSSYGLDYYGF